MPTKDWRSISGFLARYLSMDIPVDDSVDKAMMLANWIICREPELAPYVFQVIVEGD